MMDTIQTIVQFFQTGGTFMYPILIVFAFGVAICIERYVKLTGIGKANKQVWDQVHPLLDEGNFDAARDSISEDESTIANLLNMGLERQGSVRRRDDIEIAMVVWLSATRFSKGENDHLAYIAVTVSVTVGAPSAPALTAPANGAITTSGSSPAFSICTIASCPTTVWCVSTWLSTLPSE